MSESFERGMKIFRENLAGMYDNGHMTKWADVDTSVDLDRLQRAHDHELEQARKAEYSRGYEDGRRSKDADHAAVVLRLSNLRFDGGSHENLSRIAQAIYPCATGWTCESSKGLRDRLIDLLGGVHNRDGLVYRCFNACGDPGPRGVGEPTEAMTYDVLGNERHKAVCKLRKLRERDVKIWNIEISIALGLDLDASNDNVCDRLIYLLGGDECSFSVGENYMDAMGEKSNPAETSGASTDHVILDTPLPEDGTSPNDDGTCPNNDTTSSIIDELLDFIDANWPTEFEDARILRETAGSVPSTLLAIASRMERRFAKALISRSSELGCYKLRINQLESERDDLRSKLEEADAAIANWRVRERSFDESERLREKLQDEMKELQDELKELEEFEPDIAMTAYGDDNDELRRLLYRAAKLLANAEQERDANYAYWMDCKEKVVQANVTIDELQDKLDAIREALDGNH